MTDQSFGCTKHLNPYSIVQLVIIRYYIVYRLLCSGHANGCVYYHSLMLICHTASVSVRDTVVLIILIALAVLGMVACVGACVTTVLNRHKQGRRSTIATDMETDFDYKG